MEVSHLKKYFRVDAKHTLKAVDDVSFSIKRGETLGLVGESGCGKTTTGRTLLRLYEPTAGRITYDGEVIFDSGLVGEDGTKSKKVAVNMLPYRRKMQIVFQDPYASLDPRMTVGDIVGEAIDIHKLAKDKNDRFNQIISLLEKVGLKKRLKHKPKEMSGGQQQRVGIARAFVAKPSIVFADEPTGNLDTKTTMEVMELIREIAHDNNQTIVMVTHDRSLAQYADRVIHILDGKVQSIETVTDIKKEETNVEEENNGTAGSVDDDNSAC